MHGSIYWYMVTLMGLYIDRNKINERERMGIAWPLYKVTMGSVVG